MDQLAINEAMGDIPTHFMKSGSCMPPKERLNTLAAFRERIIPEKAYGVPFEYDLWFNTCLLYTSPSPRDGLLSRMPSSA